MKNPWVSRCMMATAYPAGPKPAASTMYPICDMVLAASAFLMSSLAQPMMAPNSSVTAPTSTTATWA
ncbi:Uncharacterised protein [Mycobacteroides abscessus subsp. abscessus]|nr:Uncharacterised protein [Mycobacteroides abscessus subsp. abscessus]